MSNIAFSFIIPVHNRPDEIEELLQSFLKLEGSLDFEIVIIEDGSTNHSKHVVENYNEQLNISYYFKENSGPGFSRNYGMQKAKGNYFIILDSDVLLPPSYLNAVKKRLTENYVDCFGGPDAAHSSFTSLQKAIDFTMTSFITTGGIRGGKKQLQKFQPRSFNMGISKAAFEASKGFGSIHPGEDPDLSIRLWNLGYSTTLIPEAYVYHKRRISWKKFAQQVYKFGLVRPILNSWHPKTSSVMYWFPTMFSLGLICSVILLLLKITLPIKLYAVYFILIFVFSLLKTYSLIIALQSVIASIVQFFGYGYGFLKSNFVLHILKKKPEVYFPKLFF
ncbi:glycosyltransferase [Winogradskyella sp. 3972H.M.0a.05]|uniref:glycosyltransferase n=1 Tax=Winogradskyella sp. 3972H.M.0a.05 TaxID=2950277 RepID=UPI0033981D04